MLKFTDKRTTYIYTVISRNCVSRSMISSLHSTYKYYLVAASNKAVIRLCTWPI